MLAGAALAAPAMGLDHKRNADQRKAPEANRRDDGNMVGSHHPQSPAIGTQNANDQRKTGKIAGGPTEAGPSQR
jgi:hypothetical protein